MSSSRLLKAALLFVLAVLAVGVQAQTEEGELNPIKWSVRTTRSAPIKAGDRFVVGLTAQIDLGWHLYSTERVEGGPIPTRIGLAGGQPFEINGEIDSPAPHSAYDPNFQVNTEFYDGSVEFSIPVRVLAGVAADLTKVRVQLRYQTCSQTTCLPPKVLELEASLQVAGATVDEPAPPPADAQASHGLATGAQVPDFAFTDFAGKTRHFSEYRGHYVLLDFWASWCSPCIADIPLLKASYAKYRGAKFEIIGMDSETLGQSESDPAFTKGAQARAREIVIAQGVTWTQATNDTSVPVAVDVFGIGNLPAKILIDPEGRIVARIKDGAELDKVLSGLLIEKKQ